MSIFGRAEPLRAQSVADLEISPPVPFREFASRSERRVAKRPRDLLGRAGFAVSIYLATRLALLLVAGICAAVQHKSLGAVLSLFDGGWYLKLAAHGYPTHALHVKSTLGFFPLYPMVIRAVSFVTTTSYLTSALMTSFVGGALATLLVQRLATAWWGARVGRKAVLAFCLFPGTVVFSLAYSECLTVPLALGTLLALRSKRWWLAGLLAGLATAVAPVALVLVIACAVAALRQIRQARQSGDRRSYKPLAAVALSVCGIGGFAIFLWVWTGTPFATLSAQHYGWYQQSEPLGIFGLPIVHHLVAHPRDVIAYLPSWNLWNGILGGAFLLLSIIGLWRSRHELSPGAFAYVLGIGLITIWSVMTPPNARMILIATPAVLIWARRLSPRGLTVFLTVEGALFVFMSALTLSGHMLP
jgi:hypothetical protein